MRKSVAVLAVVAAVIFGSLVVAEDHEKDKPKYKISDVMKQVMKPKMLKDKVVKGEATDKEKLELLDMMIALSSQKPPQGDAESWKKLTDQTLLAAAKVAVGREGAGEEFKKAANCAACHKVHKPKQ